MLFDKTEDCDCKTGSVMITDLCLHSLKKENKKKSELHCKKYLVFLVNTVIQSHKIQQHTTEFC